MRKRFLDPLFRFWRHSCTCSCSAERPINVPQSWDQVCGATRCENLPPEYLVPKEKNVRQCSSLAGSVQANTRNRHPGPGPGTSQGSMEQRQVEAPPSRLALRCPHVRAALRRGGGRGSLSWGGTTHTASPPWHAEFFFLNHSTSHACLRLLRGFPAWLCVSCTVCEYCDTVAEGSEEG